MVCKKRGTHVANRLPPSTLWRVNDPSLWRVSKILGPDHLVMFVVLRNMTEMIHFILGSSIYR